MQILLEIRELKEIQIKTNERLKKLKVSLHMLEKGQKELTKELSHYMDKTLS